MVVATPSSRRAGTPSRVSRPARVAEPRPRDPDSDAGRMETVESGRDAHIEAWTRKRIREHVRDGVAVAAFSLAVSSAVASLVFVALRLAG